MSSFPELDLSPPLPPALIFRMNRVCAEVAAETIEGQKGDVVLSQKKKGRVTEKEVQRKVFYHWPEMQQNTEESVGSCSKF